MIKKIDLFFLVQTLQTNLKYCFAQDMETVKILIFFYIAPNAQFIIKFAIPFFSFVEMTM